MNKADLNLDSFKNNSPYAVPDGYFETQQEKLLAIPSAHSTRKLRIMPVVWSAAASVAAIDIAAYFLFSPQSAPQADLDSYIASLTDSELSQSILIDDYDTFNEYCYNEEN